MKKNYKTYFVSVLALFLLLGNLQAYSQCPSTLTTSIMTSPADCPSSGTAIISTNAPAGTPLIYTILSGPSGAPVNAPQDSSVFKALLAGKYIVKVECAGGTTATDSFTIANGYTPLNVSYTATANCGSYATGGIIKIAVTGGSAPYKYSVIKSDDPNYDDTLSAYTTSDSIAVNSYGTYQVRVYDACNQYYTITAQLVSSLSPVKIYFSLNNPVSCAYDSFKVINYIKDLRTLAPANMSLYNSFGGIKVNVYEKASGSCAPKGPLLFSYIADADGGSYNFLANPSLNYYIQIITPCGDTTTQCEDFNDIKQKTFTLHSNEVIGCGNVSNPYIETLSPYNYSPGIIYPLTVRIFPGTDSTSAAAVDTSTVLTADQIYNLSFNNLTPGTYYMVATDACGYVYTQTIADPTTAGSPSLNLSYFSTQYCSGIGTTTQTGKSSVHVYIDGFLSEQTTAKLIIVSGPSNIGDTAIKVNNQNNNDWGWINMLPGTYSVKVITNCVTDTLQLVVPVDSSQLLKQSITAIATNSCGSGSGSVTATAVYNGGNYIEYVLINNSTGARVDSNFTGAFINVAPGQYHVGLKISNLCTADYSYEINSNDVIITSPSDGPQVTKKIGVVCEDTSGSISSGSVYLEIAGGSPLKLEYRLKGDSTWIDYSDNSPSVVGINNLLPDTIYEVRVTSCGITSSTQVAVGKLAPISLVTQDQPCVGSPYTLEAPQIAGANYEWHGPNGSVISTAFNYSFGTYDSTYNGTYTCKITWGSCVTRIITVTLSSKKCSQPLSYVDIFGNVFDDGNGLKDNTVNGTGIGSPSGTQLYANLLDSAGSVIASVPVNNDGTYTFINVQPGNDVIQITINPGTVGNPAPQTQLPAGWVNTGENVGAGAGNDGIVNGLLPVTVGTSDIENANFGIDKAPVANNVTEPSQVNPGGTNTVPVPVLTGNDQEDGPYHGTGGGNTIIIDSIPSNGTLYYNGNPVTPNDTIPNYNPSLLTFDPSDTATTVTFTYSEVDSAGVVSPPATVTMSFTTLNLSGNVFDDANGLTDNTVNGTGIGLPAGTQLYANLLDSSGKVIATVPVNSDGSYKFTNLTSGNDIIQITINPGTVGNPAPSTQLPAGWVNTGENIGTSADNDGTVNGLLPVTLGATDVSNANFGIDALPNSDNKSASYAVNTPGVTYAVPGLTGSDPEDGTYGDGNAYVITTLPPGAILYYDGTPVTVGQVIDNLNSSLLTIDPADSVLTTSFSYASIDAAGKQDSTPATVTVTWSGVLLIALDNFSAAQQGSTALLQWTTVNEINARSFAIERSNNGSNWNQIGTVGASGNSLSTLNYSFNDNTASSGLNYYRLKLINADGSYSYSKVSVLNFAASKTAITLMPNPAKDYVIISLNKVSDKKLNVIVINSEGQTVLKDAINSNEQQHQLNTANLSSGIYKIVTVDSDGKVLTKQLVIQKK